LVAILASARAIRVISGMSDSRTPTALREMGRSKSFRRVTPDQKAVEGMLREVDAAGQIPLCQFVVRDQ